MSLNLGIRRTKPKHRAADKVVELRDENRRLLTQLVGAHDHIAIQEQQLADTRAKQAEAEQVVVCLAADLDERTEERDQALAEADRLRAQLAPYLAADANANAITVPPSERDTTAFEDQATAPIDVRELRNRFAAGPVVSLHHSPQAADPTHIPAPAA
ncbi:hypothetical protein G6W57_01160 [Streptomyces sp. CAI-121]|uniref:hypothetical protein n=1 Tax=unclassified Streptomyces TaxID=2593676 RepID=UPI0015876A50|nr:MULTISPECIES: hypothetical protein [unclassified Streptomyces]NUV65724.1 hypothetical protein [Streptomyces sp. CAI-121]NUW12461.1 hypothetical protein [Streptomyces sp. CAI-68]